MKAERVVCDTNVLISAALVPDGKPAAVVRLAAMQGSLLLSAEILHEVASRIKRSKFDRYLDDQDREEFLQFLQWASEKIEIQGATLGVRDPHDDKILETALVGNADCLITGDGDLLALRPIGEHAAAQRLEDTRFRSIAILRPAEFLLLVDLGDDPTGGVAT
ncbi:MAG: putative toxin-antitoxin system toxin component, PIN family [Hyphomicrobiaceae bacterium]